MTKIKKDNTGKSGFTWLDNLNIWVTTEYFI